MSNTNTNEEPLLTDEQILEFEQQIKDEEAQKVMFTNTMFLQNKSERYFLQIPLVCQEASIEALQEEFKDNEPFLKKISVMKKQSVQSKESFN